MDRRAGVAQYIDIGPGLPALGNTHDIVRRVNPQARIVYADNDPVVLAHGGELLAGERGAAMVLADIREPDELALQTLAEVGAHAAGGSYYRTKEEIRGLFDGLELVTPYDGAQPDVTWVRLWGCEDPVLADSEGSRWLYCGVARKP
jgi:hypothetical protein